MDPTDIYQAMIGGAPTDIATQKALATALRNRMQHAQLGIGTGDPAMGRLGLDQANSVDAALKQLQQTRQSDRTSADLQGYRGSLLRQGTRGQDIAVRGQDITARGQDLGLMEAQIRAAAKDKEDKKALTQNQFDNNVQKLGRQFVQNKLPQLDASIGTFNETLKNFHDRTLPGVGYLKNFPGASLVLSDEGKLVKSQSQAVANDLLNMYSGLAVTLPESERRDLEQMRSGVFSSGDLKRAWPLVVNRYNGVRSAVLGGFNKDVQKQFFENNPQGGSPEPLQPEGGDVTVRGVAPEAAAPMFSDPEKQKRYDEWKKSNGQQ